MILLSSPRDAVGVTLEIRGFGTGICSPMIYQTMIYQTMVQATAANGILPWSLSVA